MPNTAASQAGPAPGHSRQRVSVPLLAQLLDPARPGQRCVWVDLGRAQSGLIEKLTGAPNRLIVADLPRSLATGQAHWHRLEIVVAATVCDEAADRFLCWDLLNYMQADALAELSGKIAARASRDCTIHALIQYSATTMSETPAEFRLAPNLDLTISTTGELARPTPRYSPRALEKAMPALRVERTLLLNNGMQEFLFRLR